MSTDRLSLLETGEDYGEMDLFPTEPIELQTRGRSSSKAALVEMALFSPANTNYHTSPLRVSIATRFELRKAYDDHRRKRAEESPGTPEGSKGKDILTTSALGSLTPPRTGSSSKYRTYQVVGDVNQANEKKMFFPPLGGSKNEGSAPVDYGSTSALESESSLLDTSFPIETAPILPILKKENSVYGESYDIYSTKTVSPKRGDSFMAIKRQFQDRSISEDEELVAVSDALPFIPTMSYIGSRSLPRWVCKALPFMLTVGWVNFNTWGLLSALTPFAMKNVTPASDTSSDYLAYAMQLGAFALVTGDLSTTVMRVPPKTALCAFTALSFIMYFAASSTKGPSGQRQPAIQAFGHTAAPLLVILFGFLRFFEAHLVTSTYRAVARVVSPKYAEKAAVLVGTADQICTTCGCIISTIAILSRTTC